ncbi:MAG: hypothetical protein J6V09_01680 [Clostridia bacterium]|nr:hypothetical protein [Clostridia bacterium]
MRNNNMKLPTVIILIGMLAAAVSAFLTGVKKIPNVKEMDFSYSVTYKLDGEVRTLDGVFSCRFTGHDGDDPTVRSYSGDYLWDGNASDSSFTIAERDGVQLYIVAELDAAYLMGDPDKYEDAPGNKDPYVEAVDFEGVSVEFAEKFDVEIVSFEYPEPIDNSFSFAGFSFLYSYSMFAMLSVAILTVIACIIFVKKGYGVAYGALDKISVAFNFILSLSVIPFITVAVSLMPLVIAEESPMYQAYLCVPALATFAVAASIALRRRGRAKTGFAVQLAVPVLFFGQIIVSSFIDNVFS